MGNRTEPECLEEACLIVAAKAYLHDISNIDLDLEESLKNIKHDDVIRCMAYNIPLDELQERIQEHADSIQDLID